MNAADYTYRQPNGQRPSTGAEWHWMDYVGILCDRVWITIAVLVLVTVAGVVMTSRQVPMYRSSARILVEESMPKVLNVDDLLSAGTRNIEYFNTHVLALSSRSMVEAAMNQKGLGSNDRFVPQSLDDAGKISAALGYVRIEPVPRSRLIDIAVEHTDPKMAADFANGLADAYIAANLSRRMDTSMEAFGWMKRLADEYRDKIEKDRLAIHEYRKDAKAVSLEENQNIVVGKLKAVSEELTAAESQRASAEVEWSKVDAAIKGKTPLGLLACVSEDDAVKASQAELQRKQSEVALLRTRYQDKHPSMIKARNEERELMSLYDKACTDAARRIESRYKLAADKVAALRQSLAQQEQEALELDRKLVKYNELKREADADQQIYDVLVARMKETKISGDIKASNIRLVDAAEPAKRPFRPLWAKAIVTSIAIGLVLGIAISLASHFLNDGLRRVEDVESALSAKVLAVVPPVTSRIPEERARVAEMDPHAPPSEAMRFLRASLALRNDWGTMRRLLVTSTTAGEGKSLVASNLSILLAQDGQRTVLIDADMRRPTAHSMFDGIAREGLSGLLSGRATLDEVLSLTSVPNLSIIAAGDMTASPSELLNSPAMRQTLELLDKRFDRIVVDCPPVFGTSDPISLLPTMGGVIFVVLYGRTGRRAAARALNHIREGHTPVLGIVFNNVAMRFSSGYHYYYRYHDFKGSKRRHGR